MFKLHVFSLGNPSSSLHLVAVPAMIVEGKLVDNTNTCSCASKACSYIMYVNKTLGRMLSLHNNNLLLRHTLNMCLLTELYHSSQVIRSGD